MVRNVIMTTSEGYLMRFGTYRRPPRNGISPRSEGYFTWARTRRTHV